MDELTKTIASRGDLAHLALFLWASGASGLLVWTLRELARANQRFEDFVKEIAALVLTLGGVALALRRP